VTTPICAKCRGEMAIVTVRHASGRITHNPLCCNGHQPTGRVLAPVLKLVRATKEAS
jgi:hypothetical protein